MRVLVEMIDHVIAFLAAIGLYTTILLVVEIVRALLRKLQPYRRRRRARKLATWDATLVVSVDENEALITPSVQLTGDCAPKRAKLQLMLLDEGRKRLRFSRPIPEGHTNREYELTAFPPPEGNVIDDVLRWQWVLVLKSGRRTKKKWEQRLTVLEGFNAEAEIDSLLV